MKRKKLSGFTLIEALVSIVLLATVAGSLAAAFTLVANRYKNAFAREEGETFARRFVAELEYAARTSAQVTGSAASMSAYSSTSVPDQYDKMDFVLRGTQGSDLRSYSFAFVPSSVTSESAVGRFQLTRVEGANSKSYEYPVDVQVDIGTNSVRRPFYIDKDTGTVCYGFTVSTKEGTVPYRGAVPILR
jgi:type II secretory pathway pseudopilin PulG